MNSSPFTIHRIDGYIENIFLMEYPHGLLLFDSGCINDVPRIEDYCKKILGRSPADIKLIAVTHMHPDHCGGAVVLRNKYGIPIAAHKDADRWYLGLGGKVQQLLDCYMALSVARHNHRKWERMLFNRILKPDYRLEDKQMLPGFSDWQALHVPGHTLHDMVFFNEQASLLYIADLICEVKGKKLLPLPILFPDKMARSYDKLASLNAATLLLAHGQDIHTANSSELFGFMKEMLYLPPNRLTKRVHRISIYSPEARRKLCRICN